MRYIAYEVLLVCVRAPHLDGARGPAAAERTLAEDDGPDVTPEHERRGPNIRNMMIYLSAYRLGARADALATSRGRAAIILNALDSFPNRLLSWDREVSDLERLGYSSTELDLREFWDRPEALSQRLSDIDLLWVVGGNAFVLARATTAAGVSQALSQAPHVTYAGYSAGACVTSVDLAGIDLMDAADELPEGYDANMPVETLNLTRTRVVPHAGTPEADAAECHLTTRGLPFTALADGDDLIITS